MPLIHNYYVVLKSGLPTADLEILKEHSRRLDMEGTEVPLFLCTSIDTSHGYYLKIDTFLPGDEATFSLQIPHQYVLLISGDAEVRGVGFTASDWS
jgi:hypothetical protein